MWIQEIGNSAFPRGSLTVTLPNEFDIFTWRIALSPILFGNTPLYSDLVAAANKRRVSELPITLEVIFPGEYPSSPPFVRVLSPYFEFRTGHVTLGGSICMELLTRSAWIPTCSLESVLVSILIDMEAGEARLDARRMLSMGEYSISEARSAFQRAAYTHGWSAWYKWGRMYCLDIIHICETRFIFTILGLPSLRHFNPPLQWRECNLIIVVWMLRNPNITTRPENDWCCFKFATRQYRKCTLPSLMTSAMTSVMSSITILVMFSPAPFSKPLWPFRISPSPRSHFRPIAVGES